jgi:hypothetical protein
LDLGEVTRNPIRRRPYPGPPGSSNWISYAGWLNTTGQPISSFSSAWTVPEPPATPSTQLIYLFNGAEPADSSAVLQPVLQWGDSGPDDDGVNRTGPFWTVASWIAPAPNGHTYHTPHVRVNPGDRLVGLMELQSSASESPVYTCRFDGIHGTELPPFQIQELVWCIHTLEAYELVDPPDTLPYDLTAKTRYPNAASVQFGEISVRLADSSSRSGWIAGDPVTTLGEYTSVDIDSTANGAITIHF